MKYITFSIFTLIILSCSSFSQGNSHQLEEAIKPQVQNGEFRSVIIGSYENNSPEAYYSFGEISAENTNTPTSDDIFEIGSLSKVFTGLVLSSLHLEGTLNINDKVSTVLTTLKGKPAGDITLLELVTHMSGLKRIPSNLTNVDLKDPYAKYTEKMLLTYLESLKEIKKPKLFSWKNYSNTGFGLLGYILQKKTSLSYEQLVKKYITVPLGMNDTYVVVPKEKENRLVPGHNELLNKTPYWLLLSSMNGAGALKSTASDLMLFLKANISPDSTSISEVLKFSQRPRFTNGDKGIGIAWGLKLKDGNLEGIGHNGGTGGFVSDFQISLVKEKGFLYLVNTSNSPQCVASILIKSEECKPKFSRPVKEELLNKYIGTYKNKQTGLTFVLSKHFNQLIYALPGQEMGKTTSISDTEFSIKGIAFIRFNQGDDKFEFEQNKAKLIFTKVSTKE